MRPARAIPAAPAIVALALFPIATELRGQELVRAEDALVALFSLQTEYQVDALMLQRMDEKHGDNRVAVDEAARRVVVLYGELDSLMTLYREALGARDAGEGDGEPGGEARKDPAALEAEMETLEAEIMAAERLEASLREDGRRLRTEMKVRRERLGLLAQRIDALEASIPSQREAVTGVWDLTMLPGGERGVFALFQSGTIVKGQYVLDGPFNGSLDGTLIDRKIMLHRIDSRLGRSMDFSGFLSADGEMIRGSWENYDLSDGQARTGSWSARRRNPREADEEEEGREGGSSP